MTATLAASQAILKERYPDGNVPKAQYADFPFIATVEKWEKWDGDNLKLPVQTENPQGSSADFATALGALAQGNYVAFVPERVEHYGLVRIKGHLLKAAYGKSEGAFLDMWKNELDGISQTEIQNLEIYAFGNGTGVLGTTTGSVAGTSITLTNPEDAAKFSVNMKVQVVDSATSLSPTLRAGEATVTAVTRDLTTATVTIAANWNATFVGMVSGDSVVRSGDAASAGTGTVITGLQQWLAGGASPGTLWGVNRNTDPVRLASQSLNLTTVPMEDGLIDLDSAITFQGQISGKRTAWCNPRDLRKLRKALGGKVTYPRTTVNSTKAGISFSGFVFEGDSGNITIMSSPFCTVGQLFMLDMDKVQLPSLGPAPHLLDYDSENFLRVSNDNAFEARFATYANLVVKSPVAHGRATNWGA